MLSLEQIAQENREELGKLSAKALAAVVIATLHFASEMLKEELNAAIRDYEALGAGDKVEDL